MGTSSILRFGRIVGIGGGLVGLAACGLTEPPERLEQPPGFGERPSAATRAAEHAEPRIARRNVYDEDGDGFVSEAEAEGYYRRHFGLLDQNDDGQLSQAEIETEPVGATAQQVTIEAPVGATEQDFVDDGLRRYKVRADQSVGMMSTKDFGEMFGGSEPASTE